MMTILEKKIAIISKDISKDYSTQGKRLLFQNQKISVFIFL